MDMLSRTVPLHQSV
nr:unnamed protein product [Callosobruchus chinensis]CAH7763538.1 unnamed protein product [Callosobruchus chinensis]